MAPDPRLKVVTPQLTGADGAPRIAELLDEERGDLPLVGARSPPASS